MAFLRVPAEAPPLRSYEKPVFVGKRGGGADEFRYCEVLRTSGVSWSEVVGLSPKNIVFLTIERGGKACVPPTAAGQLHWAMSAADASVAGVGGALGNILSGWFPVEEVNVDEDVVKAGAARLLSGDGGLEEDVLFHAGLCAWRQLHGDEVGRRGLLDLISRRADEMDRGSRACKSLECLLSGCEDLEVRELWRCFCGSSLCGEVVEQECGFGVCGEGVVVGEEDEEGRLYEVCLRVVEGLKRCVGRLGGEVDVEVLGEVAAGVGVLDAVCRRAGMMWVHDVLIREMLWEEELLGLVGRLSARALLSGGRLSRETGSMRILAAGRVARALSNVLRMCEHASVGDRLGSGALFLPGDTVALGVWGEDERGVGEGRERRKLVARARQPALLGAALLWLAARRCPPLLFLARDAKSAYAKERARGIKRPAHADQLGAARDEPWYVRVISGLQGLKMGAWAVADVRAIAPPSEPIHPIVLFLPIPTPNSGKSRKK